MAPTAAPPCSCGRVGAAAVVLACATLLACHDTPTEPAPSPTATPTATPTAVPSATPTPSPTVTPTAVPPVGFTSAGGGCDPIPSKASTLTADVCACMAEPMTVTVDAGGPQPFACDGTVGIFSGSVVTVRTGRWSITEKLGVVDPHCWIAARLVCKP